MDDQSKNLILAIALSIAVIIGWQQFFPPPPPPPEAEAAAVVEGGPIVPSETLSAPDTGSETAITAQADAPRIRIETPLLSGSISLVGGHFDDLSLTRYKESLEPDAANVTLLSPPGTEGAIYAHFGWGAVAGSEAGTLPGPSTPWVQRGQNALSTETPVTLEWTNDKGLKFTRRIEIDDAYLFTITESVENTGAAQARLYSFGVVERKGIPADLRGFFILHEGVVQMSDGILCERDYSGSSWFGCTSLQKLDHIAEEGGPAVVTEVTTNGWIGFTEHYWQTVLIPEPGTAFTSVAKYVASSDLYRTVIRKPVATVAPGESVTAVTRLFAGPKEWETIRTYENTPGFWARLFGAEPDPDTAAVPKFLESIDWGLFFFLTKPIFAVLHWLNGLIGNMGLAIIGLTFIIKAILFPLSRKSYVSMARMKELQPEMEKLKERCGDDRQRLQKEMMELYRKEKVNPAAGCLPILLQIPIFFSLYKVIFVTIELRHAPFFGWLKDLSAPDPTSIFNFYGLLPWAAPEPGSFLALIFIGVLPLLLGISMWFQQKLNPAPTDPTQAAVFAWMPWIFMFMLGSFASGLIVYWIANNTITFAQQYIIMRSHGHRPDLFGNIKSSFKRDAPKKPEPPAQKPGQK